MATLIKMKQSLIYILQTYNNISTFLLYVLIPYYIALLICSAIVCGNGRKSLLFRGGCATCWTGWAWRCHLAYMLQTYNNNLTFLLYVLIPYYIALLICSAIVCGNGRKSLLFRGGCATCWTGWAWRCHLAYMLQTYNNNSTFLLYVLIPYYIAL